MRAMAMRTSLRVWSDLTVTASELCKETQVTTSIAIIVIIATIVLTIWGAVS